MFYKVYANGLRGWEYITSIKDKELLKSLLTSVDSDIYSRVLIIEHDKDQDISVESIELEPKTRRRYK